MIQAKLCEEMDIFYDIAGWKDEIRQFLWGESIKVLYKEMAERRRLSMYNVIEHEYFRDSYFQLNAQLNYHPQASQNLPVYVRWLFSRWRSLFCHSTSTVSSVSWVDVRIPAVIYTSTEESFIFLPFLVLLDWLKNDIVEWSYKMEV